MKELTGMSYGNRGTSEVIVGGFQDTLLRINLDRGAVTNEVGLRRQDREPTLTNGSFLGVWKRE